MKNILLSIVFVLALLPGVASACDGHFEDRYQNVVVCGGHYERVWFDPVFAQNGYVVRVGYWQNVYVPPRYERRIVQVWIPDRNRSGSFDLHVNWNWRTW